MKLLGALLFLIPIIAAADEQTNEAYLRFCERMKEPVGSAVPPKHLMFDTESEANKILYNNNYELFKAREQEGERRRALWLNRLMKTKDYRVDRWGYLDDRNNYLGIKLSPLEWLAFACDPKNESWRPLMFKWAGERCTIADELLLAMMTFEQSLPEGAGKARINRYIQSYLSLLKDPNQSHEVAVLSGLLADIR